MGLPVGNGFTRFFTNYSYERVRVTEVSDAYNDPLLLARNPFLYDSLLVGSAGERIISKVAPSLVYNSVDQPIFPTTGRRFTLSNDFAGLGGNTGSSSPRSRAWRSEGKQPDVDRRHGSSSTSTFDELRPLPIFERLFLEAAVQRALRPAVDGPRDLTTGLVLGGNKSLLFNISRSSRLPARSADSVYDAGQVRSTGQSFSMKEDIIELVPNIPLLYDRAPLSSAFRLPAGDRRDARAPVSRPRRARVRFYPSSTSRSA
jgi:hypothetical protein